TAASLHLTTAGSIVSVASNVDRLDEVDLNLLPPLAATRQRRTGYLRVINTLTQCLGVDEHDANHFATVPRSCASEIRGTIRESSGFELGCYPASVSFAINHVLYCDGLHELFCKSLLAPVDNLPGTEWAPGQPLVYYLLVHNDHLWKAARKSFIEMLIKSLLMKASYKRQIAALYAILVDILIKSVLQRSVQQHQESGRQLLKFSEDDRMPFSRWNRSLHLDTCCARRYIVGHIGFDFEWEMPFIFFLSSNIPGLTAGLHHGQSRGFAQCRRQLELLANRPGFEIAWLTSARQLAWSAQIAAGLWKRNGLALMNVNLQYSSHSQPPCRHVPQRPALVQLAAATVRQTSSYCACWTLSNCNAGLWELRVLVNLPPSATTMRPNASIVEEMLRCLINVVCERRVPGVGQSVAFMEMVEEDLLQHLVAEPQSHSKLLRLANDLVRKLPAADRQLECFAKLDGGKTKASSLREQHYSRIQSVLPAWPSLATPQGRAAQHEPNGGQLRQPPTCQLFGRPQLPAFAAAYQRPIVELLHCDVMLGLMRAVVQATKDGRRQLESGIGREVQLERVPLPDASLDEDQASGDRRFLDCVLSGIGEASLMSGDGVGAKSRLAMDSAVHGLYFGEASPTVHRQGEGARKWRQRGWQKSAVAARAAWTRPGTRRGEVRGRRQQQQKLAQDRRDRLMAKMMRMQKNFLGEYGDLRRSDSVENSTEFDFCWSTVDGPLIGPNRTVAHEPQPGLTCLLLPGGQPARLQGPHASSRTGCSAPPCSARTEAGPATPTGPAALSRPNIGRLAFLVVRPRHAPVLLFGLHGLASNVHREPGRRARAAAATCALLWPAAVQLRALPVAPACRVQLSKQQQHQFDANADSGRFDSWLSSIRDGVAAGLPKCAASRRRKNITTTTPGPAPKLRSAEQFGQGGRDCRRPRSGRCSPPCRSDCAVGLAALVAQWLSGRSLRTRISTGCISWLLNNLSLLLHLQRPNLPLPCLLEADMSTCLGAAHLLPVPHGRAAPDCSDADLCRLIRTGCRQAHVF
uniref:E3 ubiquitin-protein ligase n=1 Tax=Macrostomum lignano TaxID=282301 RepID=A0A1I8FCR5_9PLAT